MNLTRRAALAVGAAGAFGLGATASRAADVTIRIGNVYPATHTIPVATRRLKELIEQKSNGRIAVQVFNNSELGSER